MRVVTFAVILAAGLGLSSMALAGDCLSYTGRAAIAGTLVSRVFPGPPNYESIAKGDRAETALILRLDRPACVDADPRDTDGFNGAVERITDIQLAPHDGKQFAALKALAGKRVSLTGSLFGAHTGHHRTPVLLGDVEAR